LSLFLLSVISGAASQQFEILQSEWRETIGLSVKVNVDRGRGGARYDGCSAA
jgi:hypothetical protein